VGAVVFITDHKFKGIRERVCEQFVKRDEYTMQCGEPMGVHSDWSLARLDPHPWLGRAAEGGSNTRCNREGCTELRLAKVHVGFQPEFLETPVEVESEEVEPDGPEEDWLDEGDDKDEHEPLLAEMPAGAVIAFLAHADAVHQLVRQKDKAYGGAWEKQGYMGNLARVLSKTERLKNMVWKDLAEKYEEPGSEDETVLDTLHDLMALCAFMATNIEEGNRWGS
jgi:hypothetical protein